MAACVVVAENGSLLLDQAQQNLGDCAFVVQTGSEWALGSLLTMTPEDALVYSAGICLVWVTAWCFKVVIRTLNVGDTHEQND